MSREIHSIPKTDRVFRDAAFAALDGMDPRTPVDNVAAAIAARLRPTYPDVVVHRQGPEARILDVDVWYVYRDGPFGQAKER